MSTRLRRLIVLLIGLVLLVSPVLIINVMGHTPILWNPYEPPEAGLPELATTPIPTSTPVVLAAGSDAGRPDAGSGHVVVDLAHFTSLGPTQFQPLADHLAGYGLDLTFWMSDTDLMNLNFDSMADLPDQSSQLEELLHDASGLVVVNPAFWWTPDETVLVKDFVADGGRLVLISDPDVSEPDEYYVPDINSLSDAFGIVFNKDYLYNVQHNDLNFTHVFQEQFLDQAAGMNGKSIVFYGARSIGGPGLPQIRTGDGTLSSLRAGMTGFTTAAIGGREENDSGRNVLALGDFDVLTEPYVNRYDNRQVVDFVANFLAGGQREETLTDFPAYLGTDVALVFGEDVPVGQELLTAGSHLQNVVEDSGRQMELVSPKQVVLTGTVPLTAATRDIIYVGSYESAALHTSLLADSGIKLTVEPVKLSDVQTPTATPSSESVGGNDEATVDEETEGEAGAEAESLFTKAISVAVEAEDGQAPTDTVTTTVVLEMETGPQFIAADTTILLRRQIGQDHWVTAVLGNSADPGDGMVASIDRLLSGDFSDCLSYSDLAICPVGSQTTEEEQQTTDEELFLPPLPSSLSLGDEEEPTDTPPRTSDILLIDDDELAQETETSEGNIYFSALLDAGYFPDLWYTSLDGVPDSTNLSGYKWVIWSVGDYEQNNLDATQLEMLVTFFDDGGTITISGRQLPMDYGEAASTIADVTVSQAIPELVVDLPTDPIALSEGLAPVIPLPQPEENERAVLLRGTKSDDAEAPVMLIAGQNGPPASGEPQAIVMAMPLTWLPEENAIQLVSNMAGWVLNE